MRREKITHVLMIFGIVTTIAFLSSCASMSTMQTAKVTEKGKVGFGFGGGMVNTDIALGDADTINLKAPFLEAGIRYGVTDKLDLGAKLTLIGTATIDAKYQFLGDKDSKVAASVGLGGGYLNISSGDSESNIYDVMVPLYLSFHPADWFALYASPKYTLRMNSYSAANGMSGSSASHWYGATGGMRLGRRIAFLAEYSYFGNSEISVPFSQVTCGLSIGIN